MTDPTRTKARLPRTWPIFFARHGSFTPVQEQVIPAILDGRNTLIISATASGKTEAAIAPLLERHVLKVTFHPPPTSSRHQEEAKLPSVDGGIEGGEDERHVLKRGRTAGRLQILYICPTKALVRDLHERLRQPLDWLGVALKMKSGDTGPVSASHPPTVLITTPESTDSLLTRAPRLLATLDAIVLDEIHLFDGGPRGDHIRCLLRRVEHIRRYRQQELGFAHFVPLHRLALSATVPDPAGVAARYLVGPEQKLGPQLIQVGGGRDLLAEITPMAGLSDLVRALALRAGGQASIRKSLIFCNTRNEVEQTAAYLRRHLPYAAAIFVHYSNLDPAKRKQVEDDFAEASVAICVASSTLELGIDIGSIDDVALVGPPFTVTSFLQRAGRGGRRTGTTQVLCLPRSPLEEIRFHALLELTHTAQLALPPSPTPSLSSSPSLPPAPSLFRPFSPSPSPFRPSILVQQIFSILKQSPTGGIRLADLRRVTPLALADETLERIFNHLTANGYLRTGRLGEWRPGPALDDLLDAHEIYSNIGADPLTFIIVDAYSGRTIAQTDRVRLQGELLLMGGRTMEVVWRDRYKIGVRARKSDPTDEALRFHTAPMAIPFEIGQAVAAHLGLGPGQLCLLHNEEETLLFHFWGDLYGRLLAGILQAHFGFDADEAPLSRLNEHCLRLPGPLLELPPWDDFGVRRQLRILYPQLAAYLELGRFHSLLPPDLAYETVVEHCNLPRFQQLYQAAEITMPGAGLRTQLLELVG